MPVPSRIRSLFIVLPLVTGSIALVFISLEIAFHVKDALYPVELSPIVEPHPERGWQARTRYHFSGMKRDAENREYAVEVITDENGFRAFGDLDADACRVFCIGDSFTFAEDADQSQTYFAVAADILCGLPQNWYHWLKWNLYP